MKIDYRADPTEEEPKMVLSSSQNKQIRQILKDKYESKPFMSLMFILFLLMLVVK